MVKAIRFDKTGGPEVMKWVDVEVGEPGAGEIRIRQTAVGLNYIDVYFRTGLYPLPIAWRTWPVRLAHTRRSVCCRRCMPSRCRTR